MRWLLILLVVLLAAWYGLPDPEPVPIEESVIAVPVESLQKAGQLNDAHLEQAEARKRKLEEAVDGDG